MTVQYPAPRGEFFEDAHGRRVADPYRPLENLKNPGVAAWYKDQTAVTRARLDAISGRQTLLELMRAFDARREVSISHLTISDDGRYFYLRRRSGEEVATLCVREGFSGVERELFSPVEWEGGVASITDISPSPDGAHVAVEVAAGGSESGVLIVLETASGRMLPDRIECCWYASPSWLSGGNGFVYTRMNSMGVHDLAREVDCVARLHRLGEDPAQDRELVSRLLCPELGMVREQLPFVTVSREAGCLLLGLLTVAAEQNLWMGPLSLLEGQGEWRQIARPEDEIMQVALSTTHLYALSAKDAPKMRILRARLETPEAFEEIVPEDGEAVIDGMALTSEGIGFVRCTDGVRSAAFFWSESEGVRELVLPSPAGALGVSSRGAKFPDLWFRAHSWTRDAIRYRCDPIAGSFTPENLQPVVEHPEFADLAVEECCVTAKDGARIPLSVIAPKGSKRAEMPLLLYCYGAYGFSLSPMRHDYWLLWAAQGGVLAIAHVRGGGERGREWHLGGFKATKPNTWGDLIDCAEWLVREGYSSPAHMVIRGRSAGGIPIGRAMIDRPDLFAAVIAEVGAMNPFHADRSPNGPINEPEFGSRKDHAESEALLAMDAYLQLREGVAYPAALVTAGMNDARVIFWEPGKFAARMQASTTSGKPVFLLAEEGVGHGIGDTKSIEMETHADALAFGLWQAGHPCFQPASGGVEAFGGTDD